MGWGSGAGKGKILAPAAGDLVHVSAHNPFDGKMVLTDISGLAHRASKKQPKQVAQEGISQRQQQYVMQHLQGVHGDPLVMVGDGATDVEARPPATAVIGFGKNVVRESVLRDADWFVYDFKEMMNAL